MNSSFVTGRAEAGAAFTAQQQAYVHSYNTYPNLQVIYTYMCPGMFYWSSDSLYPFTAIEYVHIGDPVVEGVPVLLGVTTLWNHLCMKH